MGARRLLVAVAGLAVAASACGSASSDGNASIAAGSGTAPRIGVEERKTADFGEVLTTLEGRTLYVYSRDTNGTSVCNVSKCVREWPPYVVPPGSTVVQGAIRVLSVITRSDGLKQLALNGRPLYTDIADKAAGQFHGQGEGGVWFIATESGFTTAGTGVTKPPTGDFPTPPPITGGGYGY